MFSQTSRIDYNTWLLHSRRRLRYKNELAPAAGVVGQDVIRAVKRKDLG